MVVFKNIPQGAIEFNIENARKLFEKNKNEQQNLVVNWEKWMKREKKIEIITKLMFKYFLLRYTVLLL